MRINKELINGLIANLIYMYLQNEFLPDIASHKLLSSKFLILLFNSSVSFFESLLSQDIRKNSTRKNSILFI
jgi:hypothetical protein